MGGAGSKPRPEPPKGCFFYPMDGAWPPLGNIINWIIFGRTVDCDCREQQTCPNGPPPRPPLEQFLKRSTPAELYAECKFTELPHQREFDKNLGGWNLEEWKEKTIDDDDIDLVDDHVSAGGKSLARRSVQQYEAVALQTYHSMPLSKRAALQRHFAGRMPAESLNASSTARDMDDVVMLSILLGEPDRWATRVVRHLPAQKVEMLVECARYAVSEGLDRISDVLAARDTAQPTWRRAISLRSLMPDEPAYMQQAAESYLNSLPHFHGRLAARATGNETQSTKHGDDGNGTSNSTCVLVYQQAVSNFDSTIATGQYVASYDEVMMALDRHGYSDTGRLVEALRKPNMPNWRMNWTEQNMRSIYGEAFPAIAVGMNLLTLSLHASSQGLLDAYY